MFIKKEASTFWVTNTCNRNVSLADLNVTIKAFSSVNLLDGKHYPYTLAQLQQSQRSGSLFKKSRLIVVRHVAPEQLVADRPLLSETYLPSRERSGVSIKEVEYEELNISDELFAEENADIAEADRQPIFTKG